MAEHLAIRVPQVNHLDLRAAIQEGPDVLDHLLYRLRIADTKGGRFALAVHQGEPVRVGFEVRLRTPGMHGVPTEDEMKAAPADLGGTPAAPLVPQLGLAVGVLAWVDPVHAVLGQPVGDGRGLLDTPHGKVQHHAVFERGLRIDVHHAQ